MELELGLLFQASTVSDMTAAIVQYQAKLADQGDIERPLAELEALCEEGAPQLLADEGAGR